MRIFQLLLILSTAGFVSACTTPQFGAGQVHWRVGDNIHNPKN